MDADGSDLEQMLLTLWAAGREAWPTLPVPQDLFTAHLQPILASEPEPSAYLKTLKGEDLYLACACTLRLPGSHEAFDRRYLAQMPLYLSHMNLPAAMVEDVRQLVSARLFVNEAGSPPRIASYGGRSSLPSWLRTLAVRTALNLKAKKDEQHTGMQREDVADRVFAVAQDPEMEFIKARYADAFRTAIRSAVRELPEEQRTVLHLYVVEGLTTTRIGALFQVSHTAVSRWLSSAREAILEQTQALLRRQLGINTEEFLSLVRLVRSQLDVSLAGALEGRDARLPQR